MADPVMPGLPAAPVAADPLAPFPDTAPLVCWVLVVAPPAALWAKAGAAASKATEQNMAIRRGFACMSSLPFMKTLADKNRQAVWEQRSPVVPDASRLTEGEQWSA
jgi:hypothetical protein